MGANPNRGSSTSNNHNSGSDAYHFDNFSYSRSSRHRPSNNVRSNLATPFQLPQGYYSSNHNGGTNNTVNFNDTSSQSSRDAMEDAEKGFRPFPERSDTYPLNVSVNSRMENPRTQEDETHIISPLHHSNTAPPRIPPILAEVPDHAHFENDTESTSSSITATDHDYVTEKQLPYPVFAPHLEPATTLNIPPQAPLQQDLHGNLYGEAVSFKTMPDDSDVKEEEVHTTVKKFLTTNGNLILDSDTASYLLKEYKLEAKGNEFAYMRYSSVTCDPNQFRVSKFNLRQNFYKIPRQTEILICITLYDEEPFLVARTLKGVIQNIIHLTKLKHSEVWGDESWKKIVVCFVADGRNKVNPKTLALFSSIGVYQDGFARGQIGEKKVQAHLYEHTTMLGVQNTDEGDITFVRNPVPVQLLLCLKERNKKKINSHRWCFESFADVLNPRVVVLLDAGTQPSRDSLYHLWNSFYMNPQIGGCCGEIKAALGPKFSNLLNPLVAAQNFEYKISNILDKPTESTFGFISVLPGAFSAYRYEAILNDENGVGPLEKYFKGEDLDKDPSAGVFQKNMYLAEDRILCFELVAKKKSNWTLKYVKAATAETDTPTAISALIKQRRRWLNGSFFASFYSITHFWRIWSSGHSFVRKMMLMVEFFYQTVQLVVSWFSIASFFLVFRILSVSLEGYFGGAKILAGIFLWMYVATTVITFVLSFGNRPEGTSKVYFVMLIFYAVLMSYTMFAAVFMSVKAVQDFLKERNFQELVFHNSRFRDLTVSLSCTYGLYFLASFLYFEPWHMFTSFLQYLLISPTYINVLNIYAFCNLHDLSWGNRDDEIIEEKPLQMTKVQKDELEELDVNEEVLQNEFLVSMDAPMDRRDVDIQYAKKWHELREPGKSNYETNRFGMKVRIDGRDADTKAKDYYALVRSLVVIFWMATNCCLVAVVLSMDGFTDSSHLESVYERRSEIFLTVILWIVAFLAAFRFVGCVIYLINYLGERMIDWDIRKQSLRYPNYAI
ncbi:hypothetical protein DASC09_003620 [Saccharomycopsis crataegensis]|uniref:chitin synthase n=1 Tax=Saccharomycopsis crataegensis TaxID=43959 RepID=A0AAV5QEF1_9ASCO|nr:hypothetical protein DASC09_003620 [Saccharomycopsis crataegensis]